MAEPSTAESSPDRDFDPSADMLVNDFDDERTMEEEEAMESSEEAQNELDDLQKEGDMPIEDLLSMYGYGDGSQVDHPVDTQSSSSEEILSNQDLTLDKDEIARDLLQMGDQQGVKDDIPAHDLMDAVDASISTSRLLRSAVSHHQSESESESDNGEYIPEEDDDWKKVIQVGSDYQAVIPDGLRRYDGAPAYENDDKLVWDPSEVTDSDVDQYLQKCQQPLNSNVQGVHSIPCGSHVRDDEQALYMLLQCGYNIEEAMRRRRMQSVLATDTMSLWSEEECRSFENGLRTYGKEFHLIQHNKVRTRSVGELVQFYYLWKKTERHDVFANKARLEKKKYTLHPGTTDYMDRFLDEQENPSQQQQQQHRDRSSSPNIHSLISGDHKRQHQQQQQQQQQQQYQHQHQHHSRSSPANLSKTDDASSAGYRPRLASSSQTAAVASAAATNQEQQNRSRIGEELAANQSRLHPPMMQQQEQQQQQPEVLTTTSVSPPLIHGQQQQHHHHHHLHHPHHHHNHHQLIGDLARNNFGNVTTKLAAFSSDALPSNGVAATIANSNGVISTHNNNNNNNNDVEANVGATFKTLEMSISTVSSHSGRHHHVAASSSVTSHANSAVQ